MELLYTALAIAIIAFLYFAFDDRLRVRHYEIYSNKINEDFRIIQLSDLHGTYYGIAQSELLARVYSLNPDAVVFTGDMFDARYPDAAFYSMLEGLDGLPCFYVTGNHELECPELGEKLCKLKEYGVNILENEKSVIEINGQKISFCGLFDEGKTANEKEKEQFITNLKGLSENHEGYFTILLSHRPEKFMQYVNCGYDLVLCGHAHGGQWRLPPFINGLYAPHQGIFPKYAGGKYQSKGTTMLVSRGLSKKNLIPRIFNPVEFSCIDIKAK